MDPLSSFAIAVAAVAKLLEKVIEGQTPEQKLIIWNWFISDITEMRKFFGLSSGGPKSVQHSLEEIKDGNGHCER